MEQVRLCAVWLGSFLNQIQGWTIVRESYSHDLEQGSLIAGVLFRGCRRIRRVAGLNDPWRDGGGTRGMGGSRATHAGGGTPEIINSPRLKVKNIMSVLALVILF